MDHHGAVLKARIATIRRPLDRRRTPPAPPVFPRGSRVFWGTTDTEAVGTVCSDTPDPDGWLLVAWDGIGTYKENPANLRVVPAP